MKPNAFVRFITKILGFPVPIDLPPVPRARIGDEPSGDPQPDDDVPPTPRPMKPARYTCSCGKPAQQVVLLGGLEHLRLCRDCITRMAWATQAHVWCVDKRPAA